jgi:hypothetical protein
MQAGFFTKSLQGSTLRKCRDQILNISGDPAPTTNRDHRSVLSNQKNNRANITQGITSTSPRTACGPLKTKNFIKDEIQGTARNTVLSY